MALAQLYKYESGVKNNLLTARTKEQAELSHNRKKPQGVKSKDRNWYRGVTLTATSTFKARDRKSVV